MNHNATTPEAGHQDQAKQAMTFQQYRLAATRDDIKKIRSQSRPYWWENLPILGTEIYRFRITYLIRRLDRGMLRAEIFRLTIIILVATLFVGFGVAFTLTPWFYWAVIKRAITNVEAKLAQGIG